MPRKYQYLHAHPQIDTILEQIANGIPLNTIARNANPTVHRNSLSRLKSKMLTIVKSTDETMVNDPPKDSAESVETKQLRLISRLSQHDALEDQAIKAAAKALNWKGLAVLLRAQATRVELAAKLMGLLSPSHVHVDARQVNVLMPVSHSHEVDG